MSTRLNISLFASCSKMYKVMWFLSGSKYVYELEWFSAWNTKTANKFHKRKTLVSVDVFCVYFLFRHFAKQETNKIRTKDVRSNVKWEGRGFNSESMKDLNFNIPKIFFLSWLFPNSIALHFEIPKTKNSTYIFLRKHAWAAPQIYANDSNQNRKREEKPN